MKPQLARVFVHTRRLEEVAAFFRDRLGLEERFRDAGQSVWFETGAATLVVHAPNDDLDPGPYEPSRGGVLLWLELDEGIDDRYRELADAGVTITMAIRRVPARTLFVIADPEGRRIGFYQSHSDPPPPFPAERIEDEP